MGAVEANGAYTQTLLDGNGGCRLTVDSVDNEWSYVTDALGREVVHTDPAGAKVTTTYDAVGRVTEVKDRDSRTIDYSYDHADRVSNHTWSSKVGTVAYAGSNTYTYDARSQLTNDGATAYGYDANGNRNTTGYATGTANRMSNDGTFTYTYDAEGNTLTKSKGSGLETWYYGWDDRNRMTSVRETSNGTTNTLTVTYTYDVENNLVQEDKWKTGGSVATVRHAYDGANVWADLDGSNVGQTRYLLADGMDQLLARTVLSGANAGLWAYLTDRLGSVRDEVQASTGSLLTHVDFGGFGGVLTVGGGWYGDAGRWTGRVQDPDTGLQQDRMRWLQLSTGKWLNPDPWGFGAGDANLYRYAGNNATNATDPTGLKESGWSFSNVLDSMAILPIVAATWALAPDSAFKPNGNQYDAWMGGFSGRLDAGVDIAVKLVDIASGGTFIDQVVVAPSKPGLVESVIPVIGSVRNADYHFSRQELGLAAVYVVFALIDFMSLGSLSGALKGGVYGASRLTLSLGGGGLRLGGAGGATLATSGGISISVAITEEAAALAFILGNKAILAFNVDANPDGSGDAPQRVPGVGGNGAASQVPNLSGLSPAEAIQALEQAGFRGGKVTQGGWGTFKHTDGSRIDIGPGGRVVRTAAPRYGPDGRRINNGQRLGPDGAEIPRDLPHGTRPANRV
jgi:RHS repeat-associated protein